MQLLNGILFSKIVFFKGSGANCVNTKNNIIFENQKIDLDYNNNRTKIVGSGEVFIQNNADFIKYEITNIKENYFYNLNLDIHIQIYFDIIYKMEGLERMHLVHARLLYIIADMYKNGIGTKKDLVKSAYWVKKVEEAKL